MDFDLRTWGPLTVLAVAVTLLVVIGGLIVVIMGDMTFEKFLDDILKWIGAALALGASIGRGIRLQDTPVSGKRKRTT